jgi:hypothetical protein
MSPIKEIASAEKLLDYDEDQLVQLLNSSRVKGARFDISWIPGLCDLSTAQKEALSRNFR